MMSDKNTNTEFPEGFKMTELGSLPEEWEVRRLGEVVTDKIGGDWGYDTGDAQETIKCLVLRGTDFKDASNNHLFNVPLRFVKRQSYEKRRLVNNDILVELSGGSTDQPTGRVLLVTKKLLEIPNKKVLFSNFVKKLKLNEIIVNSEYFYRYWQYLYFWGRTSIYEKRTTGIRNFKYADFLDTEKILLPPFSEQQRIAAVLSCVQSAKEKTEAVIAATKELKKSLLKHLFGYGVCRIDEVERVKRKETEIGLMPEEWEVKRLGEVCEIKSGGTPSKQVKEYWENGNIPWIKSEQCHDRIIYNTSGVITEIGLKNSSAKILKPNTVLVAMVGATIGKTGFLTFIASTNQNIAGLYPINDLRLNSFYLFHAMQSRYEVFTQMGGYTIANLSFIKSFPIPLPPLPIQQKIADILSAVDKKIEAEEGKKKALEGLFKTLLHNLMTGKIRLEV